MQDWCDRLFSSHAVLWDRSSSKDFAYTKAFSLYPCCITAHDSILLGSALKCVWIWLAGTSTLQSRKMASAIHSQQFTLRLQRTQQSLKRFWADLPALTRYAFMERSMLWGAIAVFRVQTWKWQLKDWEHQAVLLMRLRRTSVQQIKAGSSRLWRPAS